MSLPAKELFDLFDREKALRARLRDLEDGLEPGPIDPFSDLGREYKVVLRELRDLVESRLLRKGIG